MNNKKITDSEIDRVISENTFFRKTLQEKDEIIDNIYSENRKTLKTIILIIVFCYLTFFAIFAVEVNK